MTQDIDIRTAAAYFDLHNRSVGKTPGTIREYIRVTEGFARWLELRGRSTQICSLRPMDFREFVLHMQKRPGIGREFASTYTVSGRVRHLRAFFAWLHREGYAEEHLMENIKPPKVDQLTIEPLTVSEIGTIVSSLNPTTWSGARNLAMFSLMLDAGLRLSEVSYLRVADVNLEAGYVKVLGKGMKERIVAFGSQCLKRLIRYYFRFRPQLDRWGTDSFFLTKTGGPMTWHATCSWVKRLAVESGIPRLHAHLLRHTYASMFLLNGGDVFTLQHNLGHTTLQMVQRYVHIASSQAAVRSQAFSPLDRVGQPRGREEHRSAEEYRARYAAMHDLDGRGYASRPKPGS